MSATVSRSRSRAASTPVSRLQRTFSVQLQNCCFNSGSALSLSGWDCDSDDDGTADFAGQYPSFKPPTAAVAKQRAPSKEDVCQGSSSLGTSAVNLAKSLVGVGMLTLPRAFADGSALPTALLSLFCGALSGLSFFMLGYCAHVTNTTTLPRLWEATVGQTASTLVELVIVADTLLGCVAFVMLIGDYCTQSVQGLFSTLPAMLCSRKFFVAVTSMFGLLPLCLTPRMGLLRYSSIGGLLCTLYVFLYVVGDFAGTIISEGPALVREHVELAELKPAGVLRSTAIFSLAYMAHFNAPVFYADLCDRRPSRFAMVCVLAFGAAFMIYTLFGLSGYGRFGRAVPGNALTAYSVSKPVLLMWLGMTGCVVASFPFLFLPLRDALLRLGSRLVGHAVDSDDMLATRVTVVCVLLIGFAGAVLEDVSAVVSLSGALSGTCLMFVIPGAVMLGMKRKKTLLFTTVARSFMVLGVVLGLLSFASVLYCDILQWDTV